MRGKFDHNIIADRIAFELKTGEIQQDRLAIDAGLTGKALDDIINKRTPAQLQHVYDIAQALNCTMDWLCGGDTRMTNDMDTDRIFLSWAIEDIWADDVAPQLTRDEAREVLERAKSKHDCNYGVSWQTLTDTALCVFPRITFDAAIQFCEFAEIADPDFGVTAEEIEKMLDPKRDDPRFTLVCYNRDDLTLTIFANKDRDDENMLYYEIVRDEFEEVKEETGFNIDVSDAECWHEIMPQLDKLMEEAKEGEAK